MHQSIDDTNSYQFVSLCNPFLRYEDSPTESCPTFLSFPGQRWQARSRYVHHTHMTETLYVHCTDCTRVNTGTVCPLYNVYMGVQQCNVKIISTTYEVCTGAYCDAMCTISTQVYSDLLCTVCSLHSRYTVM